MVGGNARHDLAGSPKILRPSPSRNCVRRSVRPTHGASSVSNPSIVRDPKRCRFGLVAVFLRPPRVGVGAGNGVVAVHAAVRVDKSVTSGRPCAVSWRSGVAGMRATGRTRSRPDRTCICAPAAGRGQRSRPDQFDRSRLPGNSAHYGMRDRKRICHDHLWLARYAPPPPESGRDVVSCGAESSSSFEPGPGRRAWCSRGQNGSWAP